MPDKRVPHVASMEEYDSDQKSAKPDTLVQARRRRAESIQPRRRDVASDSGYSSHNSAALQSLTAVANTSAARQTGSAKGKPVLHRAESQRKAPPRPESASRHCNDAKCRDPDCLSKRNPERRYTVSQQHTPEYLAAWDAYNKQHAAAPQQQYPSAPPVMGATATQPPPSSARPHAAAGPRPVSFHGYSGGAPAAHHGPPPSPSAYQNWAAYYPQQQQQHYYQPPVYGSTLPTQVQPNYLPPSPVAPSPSSHTMTGGIQRNQPTYSARQTNTAVSGFDYGIENTRQGLSRTISARRPPRRPIPGDYPESSESDSDSVSDYSVKEREQKSRKAKRDSALMPPPPGRPSLHKSYVTMPEVPRPLRGRIQRAPRSDTDFYDQVSSDNVDSDRTARAVVSRPRTESSYSGRSRRPSISTSGSGRTKATSVSDSSAYHKVIVTDSRGRHVQYMSKDDRDDLVRRYNRQKLEEDDVLDRVAAYQERVAGPHGPELTLDNIKKAQRRTSGSHSHVSGSGQSRKSGHSSSKASRQDGGIEIKSGGTVLHVYGGAKIEMQAGEDGAPTKLVIGSGASSRDSAYYGSSKGSSSRVSRRKQTVPTDGYESGH